MVFSSIIFLFLFLPVVLGLYFLIRRDLRNAFLLLSSLFFYFWGENWLVLVMMGSTLVDYVCGLAIAGGLKKTPSASIALVPKDVQRTWKQKLALVVSIITNLTVLAVFKYFNFGVDSFNVFMNTLGLTALQWTTALEITLPLGISFYTFQSMSYTVDVYLGNVKATRHLLNFASYVTLFPQLVAGPIVRYKDIAAQLVERVVRREDFAIGVQRFIIGLGKKVLIANTVAWQADQIFAIPDDQLTFGLTWLGIICYTLQIYFDFSGYSDMAIGMGRMFGFTFLENFEYPYIARSIREFWRRWHISLSTWFRDYLYIPLGGSRVRPWRVYRNLVIVFLLCGLWHGAAWTFVIWGIFHGVFLVLERVGLERALKQLWSPIQHLYVVLVVMVGWVLFRADTLAYALSFLGAMAGFGAGDGLEHHVGLYLDPKITLAIVVGIIGAAPIFPWLKEKERRLQAALSSRARTTVRATFSLGRLVYLGLVLFVSGVLLSSGAYNPFIYFRF